MSCVTIELSAANSRGAGMKVFEVFSSAELEELDAKQLKILSAAVVRQLRTAPEINAIIREKTAPVYDRLKGKKRK